MEKEIFQNRISFWQIVFYISWSVLAVWLILKVTGVIKTPIWLEYGVPVSGLMIGTFGIYHHILERINNLAVGLATLTVKVDHIDKDAESLKLSLNRIDERVEFIESKF